MIKTERKENSRAAEFLFVFYCFAFSFVKPLTTSLGNYSTVILLGTVAIILCLYVFKSRLQFDKSNFLIFLLFVICMLAFFAVQCIFFSDNVVLKHIYNFCIYGLIPIFLLINVKDYSYVLKRWSYLALFAGLMFLADPFLKYQWSGGYMPLGFNHLLPAFCGCIVLWLHYRKRWAFFVAVVFFVEMLLYANKGSFITAMVFAVLFFFFFRRNVTKRKNVYIILGLTIAAIILYVLRFQIFEMFYSLAKSLGVGSYSLNTLRDMLYGTGEHVYSLRTDIWMEAISEFLEHPLLGSGIGSFQTKYGYYTHNVFLDVLVSSGVFVCIFFGIMTVKSMFVSFKRGIKEEKMFLLIMLVLWIVPMQISLSLWSYIMFWIYWGNYLFKKRGVKKRG